MRAVMVTGEARQTIARMLPDWFLPQTSGYVIGRTDICTDAAFDTSLAFHTKVLVGNQVIQKETADESAVDSWPMAARQSENFSVTVDDMWNDFLQIACSLFLFLLFLCRSIHIHKRQTNI